MSRLIKTEAIILKKKYLLNKDFLVTCFTDEIGKAQIFAKGVKKITSKRLPHIQTGNLVKIVLHEKDMVYYLHDTQLISAFSDIHTHENKLHVRYTFFFILEKILPENQREIQTYDLTKKFIIHLSRANAAPHLLLKTYLNKLITMLGYSHKERTFEELIPYVEDLIHDAIPLFDAHR